MTAYRVKLVVDAVNVVDNGEARSLRLREESIAAKIIRSDPHAVNSFCVGNRQDRSAICAIRLVGKESWDLVALNIWKRCVDLLKVTVHLFVGANSTRHRIVVKIGPSIICNVAGPDPPTGGSRITLSKRERIILCLLLVSW